jgi:Tol biopolymer transport system component
VSRRLNVVVVGMLTATLASACGATTPTGQPTTTPMPLLSPTAATMPTATIAPTQSAAAALPWIAYQADGGIWLVHPDGSGARRLPDLPSTAAHPDWSPDGTRLVFVVDEDDSRDIWVANADGSDARVVVDCEAPCVDADGPAFSPDGGSIAYRVFDMVDGAFPGSRLEVLDLATGTVRVVSTTTAPDFIGNGTGVRWSADGRALVFDISTIADPGTDAERMVRSDIATVDAGAERAEPKRITDLATFPTYADWSSAGDRIVFMAQFPVAQNPDDVVFNLFTVGSDGGEVVQLTSAGTGGDPWGPTWSRDAKSIWVTIRAPELTIGWVDAATGEVHPVPGPIPGAHPREE